MKTFRIAAVWLVVSSLVGGSVHAQRSARPEFSSEAYRARIHQVHAQLGAGVLSFIDDDQATVSFPSQNDTAFYAATLKGSPASMLRYEYRVGAVFSISGSLSRQSLRVSKLRDIESGRTLPGTARINRTLLSATALFHYARRERFELYSGARGGVTFWSLRLRDLDDDFRIAEKAIPGLGVVLPHLTVIPIGAKVYPVNHLCLSAELALGSPHVASLGVGYTF